jgi:hypothetical protein
MNCTDIASESGSPWASKDASFFWCKGNIESISWDNLVESTSVFRMSISPSLYIGFKGAMFDGLASMLREEKWMVPVEWHKEIKGWEPKVLVIIVLATQQQLIWARLMCIIGSKILLEGHEWIAIIVEAMSDLGPHSLQCRWYVKDVQLIHIEFSGLNTGEVEVVEYLDSIDSAVEREFRSSAYKK